MFMSVLKSREDDRGGDSEDEIHLGTYLININYVAPLMDYLCSLGEFKEIILHFNKKPYLKISIIGIWFSSLDYYLQGYLFSQNMFNSIN